jgi:hypothetical protein
MQCNASSQLRTLFRSITRTHILRTLIHTSRVVSSELDEIWVRKVGVLIVSAGARPAVVGRTHFLNCAADAAGPAGGDVSDVLRDVGAASGRSCWEWTGWE